MTKKEILKFKKQLIAFALAGSMTTMAGCYSAPDNAVENDKEVDNHRHIMFEVGGKTHIIRECEGVILNPRYFNNDNGYITAEFVDGEYIDIMNGVYYYASNEYMLSLEEEAIENGAVVINKYGETTLKLK